MILNGKGWLTDLYSVELCVVIKQEQKKLN